MARRGVVSAGRTAKTPSSLAAAGGLFSHALGNGVVGVPVVIEEVIEI